MEAEKEKSKLEQIAKDVYAKQKELDFQLKDLETQKESLNEIRKDLIQKQKELDKITALVILLNITIQFTLIFGSSHFD